LLLIIQPKLALAAKLKKRYIIYQSALRTFPGKSLSRKDDSRKDVSRFCVWIL